MQTELEERWLASINCHILVWENTEIPDWNHALPESEVGGIGKDVADSITKLLGAKTAWSKPQWKTGIEPLWTFQNALINSPILFWLVTLLHSSRPFVDRITYFWADSQIDALMVHTGRVEMHSGLWTYFLTEERWKIFFLNGSEKTEIRNCNQNEVLMILVAIEDIPTLRVSEIFQTIRAAAIRNVTITGGSTVKYLHYLQDEKVDIWTDKDTYRNNRYHTLTLWDEQYFIGNEDGQIYLRDSTGKREAHFDDIASCVAHLEGMSANWHRIRLAKAIQTFESEHELDFEVISQHIRGAIRGRSEDRVKYIKNLWYILDHIQTFTNYIEVLERNSVAEDEKIPATIAKIGTLYLVLFCFYNSWTKGKKLTDDNFLDGLARNLYRLHRSQENERGQLWKWSIQIVRKIWVRLRDSLSPVIWLISNTKSSAADAQETIIEPRKADVVIDTFWVWYSYLGDINNHLYIAHIFNPMYRGIRMKESAFDIGEITGMLNTLSNGIGAIKTEYSRLVATGWKNPKSIGPDKSIGPELWPQTQSQPMDIQVPQPWAIPDWSEVTAQWGPQDVWVQLWGWNLDEELSSKWVKTNVVPLNPTILSFADVQAESRQKLRDLRERRAATQW